MSLSWIKDEDFEGSEEKLRRSKGVDVQDMNSFLETMENEKAKLIELVFSVKILQCWRHHNF